MTAAQDAIPQGGQNTPGGISRNPSSSFLYPAFLRVNLLPKTACWLFNLSQISFSGKDPLFLRPLYSDHQPKQLAFFPKEKCVDQLMNAYPSDNQLKAIGQLAVTS